MSGDSPTRLIERAALRVLVETSRAGTRLAHTVKRTNDEDTPPYERPPSALRGFVLLVAVAVAANVVARWAL
jgi:hypothetical protein